MITIKQLLLSLLIAISATTTLCMKNDEVSLLSAHKKQILVAKCSKLLKEHDERVNSIAYHPQGKQFASGSSDKTIRLWDTSTYECTKILSEHTQQVNVVVYHPTRHQLASGSDDKTIKLWDPETGQCIATLTDHTGNIRSLSYHPHNMELVSRSDDELIKIWDTKNNQCIGSFKDHGIFCHKYVAYHPDGEHIAMTTVQGTHIKQCNLKEWHLKKWQSKTSNNPFKEKNYDWYHQPNPSHEISSLVYNQDGSQLAFGSHDVARNAYVGIIQKNGEVIKLENPGRAIIATAFHPSKKTISASNLYDQTIRTWNTENFTESPDLFFDIRHTAYCLAYNPQGTHLATGTFDGLIQIINTKLLKDTNNLITGLEKFTTEKSQQLSIAEKEQLTNMGFRVHD